MSTIRGRFANNYKRKGAYTSDLERKTRAQKKLLDRRNSRAAGFSRNRNIGDSKENLDSQLVQNDRFKDPQRRKLEQWKEERNRQKLMTAKQKPFVCGIVRHNVGSPYASNISNNKHFKNEKNLLIAKSVIKNGRENCGKAGKTRYGAKQTEQKPETMVAIPTNFKFKFQAPVGIKPIVELPKASKRIAFAENTMQADARILQRITRSMTNVAKNSNKFISSQNAQNKISRQIRNTNEVAEKFKATTWINKSKPMEQDDVACIAEEQENFIETTTPVLNTAKDKTEYLPIHYSPFVTKERGSSRKSAMNSMQRGYSVTPKKENTVSDLEKVQEIQQEYHGIAYFRKVLQNEIERLESAIEKWILVQKNTSDLPEDISDLIDVAVGKARLLIKEKLHQFGTLIDQCELGSVPGVPALKIKCSDLEGFWDMVYIQVEDVDIQFKMLQDAESRNWQKEATTTVQIPIKKERKKQKKKGLKPVAKSSLRALIAAARKKNQAVSEQSSENLELTRTQPRRFSSPVIVNQSSARKSLLQQVLTSEANRQSLIKCSSPTVMNLSDMLNSSSSPVLLRNDGVPLKIVDMEENKMKSEEKPRSNNEVESTPKLVNVRRSSLKSLTRKVRFAAEEEDHEGKTVQPMTPYLTYRIRNSEGSEKLQKMPSTDFTNSTAKEPARVLRRSRRLNNS